MERPRRKIIDWSKSKYGYCGCGVNSAMMDGKCPQCHDADYNDEVEEYHISRLKKQKAATAYCLRFIEMSLGEKVKVEDLKHCLDKVRELES